LIACFLSNIFAKYYDNQTMLLRVTANGEPRIGICLRRKICLRPWPLSIWPSKCHRHLDNVISFITRSSATSKISHVGGHYAVQGHWFLVPIKSAYATGVSLFNALTLRNLCKYRHTLRKTIDSLYYFCRRQ